jgi:hypothetical protein
MKYNVNPFQELYVSDSASSNEFVELFSEVPLQTAIHPLFQEGNVVLSGTQGCGKTMILRLFLAETRAAYRTAKKKFPIPRRERRFISAGVNLTKSALTDVSQVTLGQGDEHDISQLPFYFADFFNYWVVKDLLANLLEVGADPDTFENLVDLSKVDQFVSCLVKQECWFGALNGCSTLDDLQTRINDRIATYRKWVTHNERYVGAPSDLRQTKTSIGEPISRTVECLKGSEVIKDDVRAYIRIDQLEELHRSTLPRQRQLRLAFRHILNRAVASRDRRVHYRLGTRRYGWQDPASLTIQGSGAQLEARRDYLLVDMDDDLFRRKEHGRRVWLFDKFAADAFRRRLAFYLGGELPANIARKVFGRSPRPEERAEQFATGRRDRREMERVLGLNDSETEAKCWSPSWRRWLLRLYKQSPLEAILAAAWGRQTGGGQSKSEHRTQPPPTRKTWAKKWWRKERLSQAVLQLAARRQQRMLWWGYADLLGLSGGNITVFLHLCHQIWDLFLKEERLKPEAKRINPLKAEPIPVHTQAAGIQLASARWYNKVAEEPGGEVRKRFIETLGKTLRQQMRGDKRMSYPGGNGVTLALKDLLADRTPNRDIWRLLRDAVGYGDLFAAEHTTKNKASEPRMKFYLNPILSPAFQLPVAHTKEPLYWNIDKIFELSCDAELPFATKRKHLSQGTEGPELLEPEDSRQLRLFVQNGDWRE